MSKTVKTSSGSRADGRRTRPRKTSQKSTEQATKDQSKQKKAKTAPARKSGREMIINVSRGEECRIVIVHQGKLEEIYFERQSSESHVGNIYKGVVTNVEPSIQAAFIDFGLGKNGFLHISDVQPQYFPGEKRTTEDVGRKIARRHRPPIQRCFKRGDQVIIQVTKEGIGTKGPTVTTYLSIPGRYLVLMPGMSKLGVSRKIEDTEDRQDMRDVLKELKLPPDMGFILRTAGLGQPKRELQRDLNYLNRLWKSVAKRIKKEPPPALLYQESDLVVRTVRDILSSDFDRIVIDDPETAEKAKEFLRIAMPRNVHLIELYTDNQPIFHKYNLEEEIEQLYSKHVPLPSGGSLVIESTEALVAIDVNSGKYREQDNAEATAYKTNMEAAKEIARQLRLRDLGGLVVCDFVDMLDDQHKRKVERTLRDLLKEHKERARILRMSQFGIIEITRQRQRPSIKSSLFQECSFCKGSGLIKTPESLMLEVMRSIQLAIHHKDIDTLTLVTSPEIGFHLLNRKRAQLAQLEASLNKRIEVKTDAACGLDQYRLEGSDRQGRAVQLYEK